MPQNHIDDVARVRNRLERFQLSNADLSQQLSDSLKRSQRLASSLGFRDIHEAQAAIDTADSDLSYRQAFEELERLRSQVRQLEQRQPRPSKGAGLHISDLVPDKIAIDVVPYALRLAYYEVSGVRQCDADELLAEGTIRMYEMMDPGFEVLQRNAKLVREWEDIFSFQAKDRRSKVSRLTIGESFRFQRALYRIMLVSCLYGVGSIPESDTDPDSEEYQTKFFMQYPTDDLFEIERVIRMIVYVAKSVMVKSRSYLSTVYVYDWAGIFLFAGPSCIMDIYRNREAEEIGLSEFLHIDDDGPASEFLTCALNHIFEARTGGKYDSNFAQRVLDHVEGADDICVQCNFQSDNGGVHLRNDSTWDDLIFIGIFFGPDDFLIPSLGIKYPETGLFDKEIKKRTSRRLMEEIFELRKGEYTLWKREDWTCVSCWISLIRDTIPIWWAEHRPQQKSGLGKEVVS